MRALFLIAVPLFTLPALPAAAHLLPPLEVAQANADETASRISYNNRLTAYQNCVASERVVESHIYTPAARTAAPTTTRATTCTYPGMYEGADVAAVRRYNEALAQQQQPTTDRVLIARTGR